MVLGVLLNGLGLLGLVIVTGRVRHRWRAERDARLAAQARPWLLALIGGDDDVAEPLDRLSALGRREWRAIMPSALTLLAQVRGQGHDALALLFDRRGLAGDALRGLSARGAVARADAAYVLGLLGRIEAVPRLRRLLGDRDPQVRAVAARALGQIGDPVAAPDLIGCLSGARQVPAHIVVQALILLGPPARPALVAALARGEAPVRAVVVDVLGFTGGYAGSAEAVPALARAVASDPAEEVRARAARALGKMGTRECLDPLLDATDPAYPEAVRAEAARALGELGAVEAVPVLRDLLGAPGYRVPHSAAEALRELGPPAWEALRVAAADAEGPAGGGPVAAHAREALAVVELRRGVRPPVGAVARVRPPSGH
ncbi:HEAT repeat domain-containing protein [Spirillospora albida]|uniref:HEAT repeat domain-containing protein n=1 Tax=Spirillospora albida TaxID=58123 RepID=UPI0012FB8E29|nr:HEAT repeat domain-containing protein [Spirillospora albida]